ncbi:MAG: hypothetical protein KGN36_05170 [Acidobacteriota bacterium]|nr:hypothetical protein [Acidobacteriota bacterium]
MKWLLATLLILPLCLRAQDDRAAIQKEMGKLDALAANPDLKPVVVAAMADGLQVHRNHVLLLRKETGRSFAAIYVSELRSRGGNDASVLRNLRSLLRNVDRQIAASGPSTDKPGLKPVVLLETGGDHTAAGDVFSLTPEIGFDSRHVAVVAGIPYYRVSSASPTASGVGDFYVSAFLRGRSAGLDFGSVLTLGAPTGDKNRGLGAGKVTVDATETISHQLGMAKPWVSIGFANSVFGNAGYLRPYIADGNAAHFGGGVDFALPHKLAAGVAGFGLAPVGNQVVYSQVVMTGAAGGGSQSPAPGGGGMMSGGGMGSGMGTGTGGGMAMPPGTPMPFYMTAQQSMVSAGELRDYGASLWGSIPLHPGVAFNAVVTRSVPFHLTSVHVGIGIDVGRVLFPGRHF